MTAVEFADHAALCRADLLRYAIPRAPSREAAEDAVQDALVAGVEKCLDFRGDAAVKTWLTAVVKNRLREAWRERLWQTNLAARVRAEASTGATRALPHDAVDDEPGRTAPLDAKLDVERALAHLDDFTRDLVRRRYIQGYQLGELSQHYNLPVSTLHRWATKALEELREFLPGYKEEAK